MVKFHPSFRSWGPFSIASIKCCRIPLSELSENKAITRLRGSIWVLSGPSEDREGAFKVREELFKNKVDEQTLVFIFGRGPFDLAPSHGSFHSNR